MHTHIHTHIPTCIHTYIHAYTHIYIHTDIPTHGSPHLCERSGLPDLFATYVPAVTFEGDNIILFLQVTSASQCWHGGGLTRGRWGCQVARFLMKAVETVTSGRHLAGTAEYLNRWQDLSQRQCAASTGRTGTPGGRWYLGQGADLSG